MTWQEEQADVYDGFVVLFDELLKKLENAEAMCEVLADDGMLTETRSYAGGVRALRNGVAGRARELRTERPDPVLPMSITTRHHTNAHRLSDQ